MFDRYVYVKMYASEKINLDLQSFIKKCQEDHVFGNPPNVSYVFGNPSNVS